MVNLKTYAKDLQYTSELLGDAVEILHGGSWAQRHPTHGKMTNCPLCGKRRREIPDLPCCNSAYTKTKRAWSEEKGFYQEECEPRVVENVLSRKTLKKIKHKIHRNLLRKQIHDLHLALANKDFLKETQNRIDGLKPFHSPYIDIMETAIPAFAERVIKTERKKTAKRKRDIQKQSRRRNRQ